jgi:hypothetical protein
VTEKRKKLPAAKTASRKVHYCIVRVASLGQKLNASEKLALHVRYNINLPSRD